MLLLGVGFICVVSSLTSAAVNAVPLHMTGMASGATSLVREFGQGLGPAVISTVAMSAASSALVGKLSGADAGMEAAAGHLAAAQTALGQGMGIGVAICGCASLLGALVTVLLVRKNTARVTVGAQVQTASDRRAGQGTEAGALSSGLCPLSRLCQRSASDVPRP